MFTQTRREAGDPTKTGARDAGQCEGWFRDRGESGGEGTNGAGLEVKLEGELEPHQDLQHIRTWSWS